MAYIVWDYSAYSSLIIAVQINLVNIVLNFGIISIGFALKVRNFLAVAVSGVLQNGITFLIQYWLIELNYSIDSLLMGYIVGRFATLFSFLLWKRLRIYASIIRRKASAVSLSLATKDHKRNIFKAFSIDQLTLYSPIIFVCFVGDSETLGFTTLALTIAMAPAILLVSSFSMPFLKSEAETLNIFTQLDNLKNNYKFLIFTSIMYLISLEFFASWIISNFLGDQWTETSNLVRGFAIPFSLYIVMMPLLQRKIGLGNSKMIRQSNLFGLIGVLLASICGLLLILFFGISSSVSSILLFYGKIVAQSLHLVLVKLKSA
jgi:O-antigen/teichoic acid export membrane protein